MYKYSKEEQEEATLADTQCAHFTILPRPGGSVKSEKRESKRFKLS